MSNSLIATRRMQPDTTECKVMVDYNLDIEYEGSEPNNEPVAQEEKDENSDT